MAKKGGKPLVFTGAFRGFWFIQFFECFIQFSERFIQFVYFFLNNLFIFAAIFLNKTLKKI